jgi:predicted ArsR family transcriptional regulator
MTHQRLQTLRYIARCGAVSIDMLSSAQGISYNAARKRLEKLRDSGMARSEIDLITQKKFGPVRMNWSLTKEGHKKLHYYETHLREVA